MIAFTNTTSEGVELWVLDLKKVKLKKLTSPKLNANLGSVISWFKDSKSLLVKFVPSKTEAIKMTEDLIPTGPRISTNDGAKAQNRTYQDLLKNKNDEKNFEILALSELYKVSIKGSKRLWKKSDMYRNINFSPDGRFVLITTIKRPFSYLVPYYRFPSTYTIYGGNGKQIAVLADIPLIEDLPKGFMSVRKGARSFSWRLDKPASICFVSALDGGDPQVESEFRDELFQIDAPFNSDPISLLKTINRYYRSSWCNDTLAIVSDYWWSNRNAKTYLFNPSNPQDGSMILSDRNYQDRYNDPGSFVKERNNFGESILALRNNNLYLIGDGFTSNGQFPFLDELDLSTMAKNRLYKSNIKGKKFLIDKKYTSKKKIVGMGGSAGGLLMGAVVNEKPDLFLGMIMAVPFVDSLTTNLDHSLPLTIGEFDEFGNAKDNKEHFDYIYSYAPYNNIKKMDYPNILITTSLSDNRVLFDEPLKFTAKLRDNKTDNNLLLLKTEMNAGHGGKSGRDGIIEEIAFDYAFICKIAKKI